MIYGLIIYEYQWMARKPLLWGVRGARWTTSRDDRLMDCDSQSARLSVDPIHWIVKTKRFSSIGSVESKQSSIWADSSLLFGVDYRCVGALGEAPQFTPDLALILLYKFVNDDDGWHRELLDAFSSQIDVIGRLKQKVKVWRAFWDSNCSFVPCWRTSLLKNVFLFRKNWEWGNTSPCSRTIQEIEFLSCLLFSRNTDWV